VYDIWKKPVPKKPQLNELFGWQGGEFMTTLSIASYIDSIAEAGKRVFEPADVCECLDDEGNWWPIPGEGLSAGGSDQSAGYL